MGIATELADFVEQTKFSDLPERLVNDAKLSLLDSIGCAIRGHSSECGRISVELARRLGGPEESSIIGTNHKVSCTNAAFANGQLISALDCHPMGAMHDVPSIVAAPLSLIEKVLTSGKELILSISSLVSPGVPMSSFSSRLVYGASPRFVIV